MAHPQPDHVREMEDFKMANHTYRSVWKLENMAEENDQSSNQQHHDVRPRLALDHNQHHQHNHHHHHHHHPPPHSNRVQSWNNNNRNKNYSYTKSASLINDPEVKRQRRVAKYKSYAVEGKMKASFRSGFRWVKNKYCQLVHGY